MGKGNACGVCGETETKLVDGFYYCAECGTQDVNLQETIVEHLALADGTFSVARRCRYSIKIKEGVEMSQEWYKWHKHNFQLAGLTEQLIKLGAAPSVRMKVLWIWTRYMKRFQKKDEMGQSQLFNQLADSSSEDELQKERESDELAPSKQGYHPRRLDRVDSALLVTILAIALNIDRSPIQLSHFLRFARFRLLTVADVFRFVPAEILAKCRTKGYSILTHFNDIPFMMGRLSKLLELGGWVPPDTERLLASQLRELRLPRGLSSLVRALMVRVPFYVRSGKLQERRFERFPMYEEKVMAYIVVALKMCFGLDDHYEQRLSDDVERINEESDYPRAYSSEPSGTRRLLSFRAWAAHLQLRALVVSQHHAPLCWARGLRVPLAAALQHFQEMTSHRERQPKRLGAVIRKGVTAKLTDQVTMDILKKFPMRHDPGLLSLEELRPAVTSLEPQTAVARSVRRLLSPERARLVDEDFTEYSLEYAYRRLALPAARPDTLRGVSDDKVCGGKRIGEDMFSCGTDPSIVYVKNCGNKHWASTRRPTAAHVRVLAGGGGGGGGSDAGGDSSGSEREEERDDNLETFHEEKEGRNIFDDDFSDITVKEEADSKDDVDVKVDEAEDNIDWIDEFENFESASRGSEEDRGGRDVFDSDDEARPRYDPAAFNRREVIREIMMAAYKKYKVAPPTRFQKEKTENTNKKLQQKRGSHLTNATKYWNNHHKRHESRATLDALVATYRSNLHSDVLHRVHQRVLAFEATQDAADTPEPPDVTFPPEPSDFSSPAGAVNANDEDVELIENDGKNDQNDNDDSCDELAYDPILKSEDIFDEKSHDVEQLYLKIREVAAPERAASPADDRVDAIIAEKIRLMKSKQLKPKERAPVKTDIDHLVDDPGRITKFNYWFTKVDPTSPAATYIMQEECEQWSPRSFWFVLKECASVLQVPPGRLYVLVNSIEQEMLKRLPKRKNIGRPRKNKDNNILEVGVLQKKSVRHRKINVRRKRDRLGERERGSRSESDVGDSRESTPTKTCTHLNRDSKLEEDNRRKIKQDQNYKNKNGNISEASDSQKRPQKHSKNIEVRSSSEDQGQPRKSDRSHKDKDISESSDTEEWTPRSPSEYVVEESSTSEDQEQTRKRGRPRKDEDLDMTLSKHHKNIGRNISEVRKRSRPRKHQDSKRKLKTPRRDKNNENLSNESDVDKLSPKRFGKDEQRISSSSEDQEYEDPKSKGDKSRNNMEKNYSDASDTEGWSPNRFGKYVEEESSTSDDQMQPGKQGRPRKHQCHEPMKRNLSEPRERSRPREDEDSKRKRERLRKDKHENLSGASDVDKCSPKRFEKDEQVESSTCEDQEDEDPKRKQHKPRNNIMEENYSDASDTDGWTPNRSTKYLEEESCASEDQKIPGKIDRTRKDAVSKRKRDQLRQYMKGEVSEASDEDEWISERSGRDEQEESSTSEDQERSEKRGRPRKDEDSKRQRDEPRNRMDEDFSEASDTDEWTPNRSKNYVEEESSSSEDEEQPRKRGRPRKDKSHEPMKINLSTPRKRGRPRKDKSHEPMKINLSTPRKRGRPRKDKSHESMKINLSTPRKRGRPRKDKSHEPMKINLSNSRKRGRPRKDEDSKRKRERLLKNQNGDFSEASDVDNWSPKRFDKDEQEESSTSEEQGQPGKRGRSLKDEDPKRKLDEPRNTMVKDFSEASNPVEWSNRSRSSTSEDQEQLRKRDKVEDSRRKRTKQLRLEENLSEERSPNRPKGTSEEQEQTGKWGRTDKCVNEGQIDDRSVIHNVVEDENTPQNHQQPRKRKFSCRKHVEHSSEASESDKLQHRTSERLSADSDSTAQEDCVKKKRTDMLSTNIAPILQEDSSSSWKNIKTPGKLYKFKDKKEKPFTFLEWRPLKDASTPQVRDLTSEQSSSKSVDRSLAEDLSAIQNVTKNNINVSQNDTNQLWSETKVINFDQF